MRSRAGRNAERRGSGGNDEVQRIPAKAGVLLALDGCIRHPLGLAFVLGRQTEGDDGPFAEAKEVIGGYWMIQVKSRGSH